MNMKKQWHVWSASTTLALALSLSFVRAAAQTIQDPPFGRPDAVVDLAARDSVQLVKGQWLYHDVKIVDADSRAVGPDLKPSGDPIKTYDYAPYAGAADFDDSQWEGIDATTLDQRRSTAKVCFNWYRISHDPRESRQLRNCGFDDRVRDCHRRLCRGLGERQDAACSWSTWRASD